MFVFPETPVPIYPLEFSNEWKTLKSDFESGAKEQRRQVWSFPRRSVKLDFRPLQQTEMDTLWNFFQARKGSLSPFWFFRPTKDKDGAWHSYTGEYVGRGNASTVIFELPGKTISSPITGSDLAVNGEFETDPTQWTAVDCTIASVAGGVSGNCLELTVVGTSGQYVHQTPTLEIGKQYRLGAYVKSGTSGNEAFTIGMMDNALVNWIGSISGTSSGTWTYYEFIFTATETNSRITLLKNTATTGTMLFDRVRLYEATGTTFKAYVNGAQAGGDFLSGGGDAGVDRFQFDTAPANGSVLTADFQGQLRLRSRFKTDMMSQELFEFVLYGTGIELLEVRV